MSFADSGTAITEHPFKRDQLFHLLHHLQITRASLVIEDSGYEFIDMSTEDILEYQLFRSGESRIIFKASYDLDKCPICGTAIVITDTDEDIVAHITQDYSCPKCGFKGTQWLHKTLVGHTSMLADHTIESFKSQYKN